ncbi:MAG: hypothetical protein HY912_23250 [Desulfomonile tiedjei]|uniref:Uncharacterized protein n=1 Tax=Desulfomonile tiedjei TaxID=2358 RepID=A0A9D6V6D8_9BACT|nr:hypothetical protein [Desulfomonile tiedjei]
MKAAKLGNEVKSVTGETWDILAETPDGLLVQRVNSMVAKPGGASIEVNVAGILTNDGDLETVGEGSIVGSNPKYVVTNGKWRTVD